ncbi:MAG: ribonuclease HII [Nitrospiraceae bacterium]
MGPTHEFERDARRRGFRRIVGLDEAGRGPLAGPVVAAAVWLPSGCSFDGLDDSKVVAPERREALYFDILRRARAVGVGLATAEEIDAINILEATRLAMSRAVVALATPPDFLLLDAIRLPNLALPQCPIVKGDQLSASIAAASIVAKVTRDRLMLDAHRCYPQYEFHLHKGYGTARHLDALAAYGPSPLHRRTFDPVRQCIAARTKQSAPPPAPLPTPMHEGCAAC